MIKKQDVLNLIADMKSRLSSRGEDEIAESVLDMVMNKVEGVEEVGEWIPVEERLPECKEGEETEALLFQLKETDTIEVGYFGRCGKYRNNYFRHYRNGTDGVDSNDVIAWKPLPEQYTGKE